MEKSFFKEKSCFFILWFFFPLALFHPFSYAFSQEHPFITLQSTSSTVNSGLYDYLLPFFEKKSGIQVHVVSSGTGAAIRNAMNGDGDLLLVHSKKAEEAFVSEGFGLKRYDVMYNDFIIVGPAHDPARIRDFSNIPDVFRSIFDKKALFVSRGDDSGTHRKERSLWKISAIDPIPYSGEWYRETGAGMGITLNIAVEMGAYTLVDRGSWLRDQNRLDSVVHVENHPILFNPYGITAVNPEKHPHVKITEAQKFIDWLIGKEGQIAIAGYRIAGRQLFFPNASREK